MADLERIAGTEDGDPTGEFGREGDTRPEVKEGAQVIDFRTLTPGQTVAGRTRRSMYRFQVVEGGEAPLLKSLDSPIVSDQDFRGLKGCLQAPIVGTNERWQFIVTDEIGGDYTTGTILGFSVLQPGDNTQFVDFAPKGLSRIPGYDTVVGGITGLIKKLVAKVRN